MYEKWGRVIEQLPHKRIYSWKRKIYLNSPQLETFSPVSITRKNHRVGEIQSQHLEHLMSRGVT